MHGSFVIGYVVVSACFFCSSNYELYICKIAHNIYYLTLHLEFRYDFYLLFHCLYIYHESAFTAWEQIVMSVTLSLSKHNYTHGNDDK